MSSTEKLDTLQRSAIIRNLEISLGCHSFWQRRANALQSQIGLQSFLSYAANNVPYYRNLFSSQAYQAKLSEFPIICKNLIAANIPDFLEQGFDIRNSFSDKTSGTSGNPLTIYYDQAAFYHDNYVTFSALIDRNPSIKEKIIPGSLAVSLVSNKQERCGMTLVIPTLRFALFNRIQIGITPAKDHEIISQLSKNCPLILYGKPTYLCELADLKVKYLLDKSTIRPYLLFVSGEPLFDDIRTRLENSFNCPVYNAYLSSEGGFIAWQCSKNLSVFHVNTPFVFLEILDSDNRIMDEGFGEILLTNPMNWRMTFIRYRTGDFGELRNETCTCGFSGKTLTRFIGREAEFFISRKGRISTQVITDSLRSLPILDYSASQASDGSVNIKWTSVNSDVEIKQTSASIEKIMHTIGIRCCAYHSERVTPRGGKASRYVRCSDIQ